MANSSSIDESINLPQTRNKVIAVSAIFLGASLMLAWATLTHIKENSKEELLSSLERTLRITNEAINIWEREKTKEIELWASSKEVKQEVKELILAPRTADSLIGHPSQKNLRAFLSGFIRSEHFQGMFVISPDNISIASTRDANLGTKNLLSQQNDFLEKVVARLEVSFCYGHRSLPCLGVGAPAGAPLL